MTINEIIQILENKISFLQSQKNSHFSNGDLNKVVELDNEISETLLVIDKLKS